MLCTFRRTVMKIKEGSQAKAAEYELFTSSFTASLQ
jgi:hypothetical protein